MPRRTVYLSDPDDRFLQELKEKHGSISKVIYISLNKLRAEQLKKYYLQKIVYPVEILDKTDYFTEATPYAPHSPYSASKASSDHLVRFYFHTYGIPVKITNCSNNYGSYQFPEKLIPLMILNTLEGKPLPVYGKGEDVRDWLYVEDHCKAIWMVIQNGRVGETYNIGGDSEWKNVDIVNKICELLEEELKENPIEFKKLITFVKDKPDYDLRYAIDFAKIKKELDWQSEETFKTGLKKTIRWYLNNKTWIYSIKTGVYKNWLANNYDN